MNDCNNEILNQLLFTKMKNSFRRVEKWLDGKKTNNMILICF